MKRAISFLLAFVLVLSMVPAGSVAVLATEETFDTENFKGLVLTTTVSGLSVKLYRGVTEDATQMTPVYTEGNDQYFEVEAGGKYYYIARPASGNARYNIRKNIYITPEEANTKQVLDVTPHIRSTAGWDTYEPVKGYSDEAMAAAFPSSAELWPEYAHLFTTPVLTNPRNPHQQTTQTEMMNYIGGLNSADDDMYVYILGKSGGKKASEYFDIPVVFFTKTDLSGAKTWEDAAALLRENGKLTFLYQAQIHGKETGAGEAAFAMLKHLDGDYGAGLLDNMNICVIPRLNTWGAYKSDRSVYTTEEIDANRDYMALTSAEVQLTVKLYNHLEPELFYDAHECFVHPEYEQLGMHDVWSSVNFVPFTTQEFKNTALTLADKIFERAAKNNLTYGWYNSSVNGYNTVMGTTNLHVRGSLVFLTESQGILGGNQQIERRIMAHVSTVTGVLDYVNENTAAVQKVVDDQRADIINRGRTYESSDVIVLETGYTTHPEQNINGKQVDTCSGEITDTVFTGSTYDVVKKSRIAPTAYVIPAGESWTADVLTLMDKQGIQYTFLPAGATLPLQQYGGTTTKATLTAESTVTFPKGAYVMTMAQGDAYILALLMEPDVKDLASYKGTLAQQGRIPATNGKFPIYRYIRDLNENDFVDYTVEEIPAKEITVYVDSTNGLDTNDGLTETTPVKTVEAAYAALSGADEGTIVLQSTLTLSGETTFPACDIPVTITGGEIATGSHLLFGGDTTLEHLKLTLTAANNTTYISAEGHKLTIGEGIDCTNATNRFCLTTRYGEGSVDGAVLTVKSGKWNNVFAAGYKSATTGNATLTVLGGDVKNLLLPTYSGNVTGDTTINIYGGTVQVAGVAPNQTGTITGDVNMNLYGGTIKKVRIRRDLSGSNIQGTATVTADGDLSGVGIIEHINPTGKITKTRLVLKQGILATTPCTFDEVSVEIPEGKTFTLKDCDITANTVNSQGTLLFSGKASLTAKKVIGSLSCDISGSVMEGQLYVTAPAGSSVTFPANTGITEAEGQWRAPGALDESTFRGLVLRAAKDVTVKLYTGYQDGSVVTPTYKVEGEELISYYYANIASGNYRSRCTGTGYYSTSQMIYMSPAEVETCTVHLVTPDKKDSTSGDNWEPSQVLLYTDEMMAMPGFNGDLSQWPEYADIFTTPWFTQDHATHQQTTQAEMEDFLNKLDDADDNLYIHSIGKSAYFQHDVWAVFLTKSDLSGTETLEAAAAGLDKTKPTVLYRAQIHGDEPGAGEAALAMIQRLDGAYGMEILEKINVVILPRTNPDGAQTNTRNLNSGLEPNRDSLVSTSQEITDFVYLYNLVMPEVVIDGHEYAAYSTNTYIWDADVLVGAGFTPSNTQSLEDVSRDMVLTTFDALGENDMTYRCYEQRLNAANAGVNRVYASKRGSLSFLVETRGNKAGLIYYPRRIAGQFIAVENLLNYTADNAQAVMQTVANERSTVVENGKTYRAEDVIALTVKEVVDESISFQLDRIYQNGKVEEKTYNPGVWVAGSRTRIAPTAYVIPAGATFAAEVLEILEKQNISYTYIPAGSQVMLQQYTGTAEEADMTEEMPVVFGSGAYVVTMDQVGGILLTHLFEPDIEGGSLVSYGVISPVDGAFPIYRYCRDLNAAGFIDYTTTDAVAAHVTVYLDGENGSDSNSGLTAAAPVKTMEQAYAAMATALQAAGEGSTGTVVVSGLYELGSATYHFPNCRFPVTITGMTTGDGLSFTGGTGDAHVNRAIHLHGETTFQNVKLHVNNSQSYNYIFANGHKLVLGTGLNTTVTKTNYYFTVSGGSALYGEKVESVDVTIRSGSWRMIYLGGYYGDVTGTAKLDLSDAFVYYSIVGSYRGNVGNLDIKLANAAISQTTDKTHGIFAGTYTANSNYNCGKLLGDAKILLGEGVTAQAVYGSARSYGHVNGKVTVIASGVDLTKVPVKARYSGLTAAYRNGETTLQLNRDVAADLTVDASVALDLCGHDITGALTVDGSLTVYDSATDDYDVEDGLYGEITGTVTGTLTAKEGYLAAADGFHRFGGQYISGVSLRPSNAGIYYTATFLADEVLLDALETGVAVSLVDMPTADFETDEDTLYTAGTNSVLIQNILKGDAEDADRAIMDIYAASYVKLPDGTVLVSTEEVAYSLYDILLILKEQNTEALQSFCSAYAIENWF